MSPLRTTFAARAVAILALAGLGATSAFASASAQQQPEDGRGQGLFNKEWHAERRAALMSTFLDKAQDKKGIIVLRGAGTQNDYREFRQDNNFWYFTGMTTPNAVYVCVPKTGEEYLLVPKVSRMEEVWNGNRIDSREAKELTGIKTCTSISKRGKGPWSNVEALLEKLTKKHSTIYVQKQPAENWMMSRDNLRSAKSAGLQDPFDKRLNRGEQFGVKLEEELGVKVQDITLMIDNMRIIKTPEEVEAMRRACAVSGKGHVSVMKSATAGEYEWQLAARMTGAFLEAGGMGAGYMAIVGSGPNACILHYTENARKLAQSDVVMIDYGAEYNHYVADISRTWPVGKKFSPRAREIYEAVYAAQEAAFKECKPGSTLNRVHAAAQAVIAKRGLGMMLHGTSHWLGMSTHDVGAGGVAFEPGMAFTVEPGVYLPKENLGVRIEDVVVITENGHEVISKMIPRSIDEIEAMRAKIGRE